MEGDDVVELTAEGKARRGTTWQRLQLRDSVFWQAADSSEFRKNAIRWRVVFRGCFLHKKIAGALSVSKDDQKVQAHSCGFYVLASSAAKEAATPTFESTTAPAW